jgi:hypothetical protein
VSKDQNQKQKFTPTPLTQTRTFDNTTHTFSFSYPKHFQVVENSPEAFEVGVVAENAVHDSVTVKVLSVLSDGNSSVDEIDQAKEICSYELQNGGIRCTNVQDTSDFVSDRGVRGVRFYLTAESYDLETNEVISYKRVGPFFALRIPQQKRILITPSLSENSDKMVQYLPQLIAETLDIAR